MSSSPDAFVWDVQFSGTAVIAGQTLHAGVFLTDGAISVVALDQIPDITLSALFDQFFSSLGAWPSDIVDLGLAQSVIFYIKVRTPHAPPGLPPGLASLSSTLDPGLYVSATVTLTLAGHVFPAALTRVAAITGKGFMLTADLADPVAFIDANFLQLAGQGFQGGPHVALQSFSEPGGAARSFALACAFTLFGHPFGEAALTISKAGDDPPSLAATLSYSGDLGDGAFSNPSLSFTWSKKNGFQVTDFPRVPIPGVVLDFAALLKNISRSSGCGALADLVLKQAIDASFFVTPSVSSLKPPGSAAADGQIYVLIDGYYKISAAGTLVVTIDLPQLVLSFSAPGGFDFDTIVSQIGSTIVANGVAVVEQLWNDRAALAKVFAAFVAKEAMSKVLANLICEELEQLARDFLEALGDAALDTIEDALAAAASALGSLGCGNGNGNGGGGTVGGISPVLNTPVLSPPMLRAGAVTVNWRPVANAAGYEAHLVDSASRLVGPVQRLSDAALGASLPASGAAGGVCQVRVKALASSQGDAIDSAYAVANVLLTGIGFGRVGSTFTIA